MKQYRIVVKGDRHSAKYFAQRRFLLIFWIPIPIHSALYGGENFYDDAVDVDGAPYTYEETDEIIETDASAPSDGVLQD